MKKWIIIATLMLSPGLRAQSSFGQIDPACFRLKVQIAEIIAKDFNSTPEKVSFHVAQIIKNSVLRVD